MHLSRSQTSETLLEDLGITVDNIRSKLKYNKEEDMYIIDCYKLPSMIEGKPVMSFENCFEKISFPLVRIMFNFPHI